MIQNATLNNLATVDNLSGTESVVFTAAEFVISCLCILMNGGVLLAVWKTPALHDLTSLFIGNLALADFLVGAAIPFGVLLPFYGAPRDFDLCVFMNSLVMMFTHASVLGFMVLTVDRYVAICYPFFYLGVMTIKKGISTVAVMWTLAISLSLVPNLGFNKEKDGFEECSVTEVMDLTYVVYISFYAVQLPVIIFTNATYIHILIIIFRIREKTERLRSSVSHSSEISRPKALSIVKGMACFPVVSLTHSLCWLPYLIGEAVRLHGGKISLRVLLFFVFLSHTKSVFNPVFYTMGSFHLRAAICKIICRRNIYRAHQGRRGSHHHLHPQGSRPHLHPHGSHQHLCQHRPPQSVKSLCCLALCPCLDSSLARRMSSIFSTASAMSHNECSREVRHDFSPGYDDDNPTGLNKRCSKVRFILTSATSDTSFTQGTSPLMRGSSTTTLSNVNDLDDPVDSSQPTDSYSLSSFHKAWFTGNKDMDTEHSEGPHNLHQRSLDATPDPELIGQLESHEQRMMYQSEVDESSPSSSSGAVKDLASSSAGMSLSMASTGPLITHLSNVHKMKRTNH